jgi:hypothetical protein
LDTVSPDPSGQHGAAPDFVNSESDFSILLDITEVI